MAAAGRAPRSQGPRLAIVVAVVIIDVLGIGLMLPVLPVLIRELSGGDLPSLAGLVVDYVILALAPDVWWVVAARILGGIMGTAVIAAPLGAVLFLIALAGDADPALPCGRARQVELELVPLRWTRIFAGRSQLRQKSGRTPKNGATPGHVVALVGRRLLKKLGEEP